MSRTIRFGLIVAAAVLLVVSCSPSPRELPQRPSNVPIDAVRIGGSKRYWWIRCTYKAGENVCAVFNAGGVLLEAGLYRPYDGGPAVPENELRIDTSRSMTSCVYLENGRVLVDDRDFDFLERLLDRDSRLRRRPVK
jgi:hypothetical protein